MTRLPAAFVARRNLSRNRLRSALAALGILVGVVAIASLGIFGNVLAVGADDALGDIGTQVIVTPNADAGVGTIDDRTVTEIERVADGTVVPLRTDGGLVERGSTSAAATIYGIENPASIYTAEEGRLPERHRQGAVVGAGLAETLELRVGDSIDVAGDSHRVIAILEEVEAFTPVSPNDAVMLPEDEVGSGDGYEQVIVQTETGSAATASAAAIDASVNDREEVVDVFELSSIVDEIDEFFSLLSAFLIGLGGISLFVAGISILNVMLMSTVERRQEIGVLRAVGVSRESILRTMLFEATLLGLIGAVLGIVVTVLLVAALYLATPIELWAVLHPMNFVYLGGAFVFGVLISVVSGLYPAWKAANERPVDALRS